MDELGINFGLLLVQLLCFGTFIIGLTAAVYFSTRVAFNRYAKIDDSELVMSFEVSEEGITIPKSVFEDVEVVELRRTKTKLILHPVVDEEK